ncbi:hypothetical protein [Streptomyces sp. CT34]|uniref:hypothetical protein n=1 Tax=Streptomyces sp. CT34 TaxID=1553907 RepID=UPI00068D8667|nr:hypothetical protein [Streptomyces sp. CT34]
MKPVIERALPDSAERKTANAQMCELLSRPDPGPIAEHLALLHFTGRRTGHPYIVPAGVHRLGQKLVVATGSPWRYNFAGGANGELTWRGLRRPVRFMLVPDLETTAQGYVELYRRYGAAAQRRLGITVDHGSEPGFTDFSDAVARCGLSLVEVLSRDPECLKATPSTNTVPDERELA